METNLNILFVDVGVEESKTFLIDKNLAKSKLGVELEPFMELGALLHKELQEDAGLLLGKYFGF